MRFNSVTQSGDAQQVWFVKRKRLDCHAAQEGGSQLSV
jgi:hypothetical protein